MSKFQIGDHVTRRKDVYDSSSRLMNGKVTRVYSDYKSRFGPYPELYEVLWDDGSIMRGLLPHGIDMGVRIGNEVDDD